MVAVLHLAVIVGWMWSWGGGESALYWAVLAVLGLPFVRPMVNAMGEAFLGLGLFVVPINSLVWGGVIRWIINRLARRILTPTSVVGA